MSADDVCHRAQPGGDGGVGADLPVDPRRGGDPLLEAVAARVPAEYRAAYLEAFDRVRADRDDSAA